jgi:aminoglycoside phosphotransferase (APT) family kinase protein
MDDARRAALAVWLRGAAARSVEISGTSLLSGGAIQHNWRLDVLVDGVAQAWVLRTDAPTGVPHSRSRAEEFALLSVAYEASVTVPELLFVCTDETVMGKTFFVMRWVEGISAGYRVVRNARLGGGREKLVAALGEELARIHSIRPPREQLAFLGAPVRVAPAVRFVAEMRAYLDHARLPRPMLEWGLRYLERAAAPAGDIVLCHNDFRTGNYLATEAGITGILDWEFAAWGDPHEDLGWMCARCWRFGSPHEVGGVGPRGPFYAAYERASGRIVDPERVRWWEIAAAIRWAVVAGAQAERHLSGAEPSLELALTAHIIPELELDIMCDTYEVPEAWR